MTPTRPPSFTRPRATALLLSALLLLLRLPPATAQEPPAPHELTIRDDASLRRALADAQPGTTLLLEPGIYRGGLSLRRTGLPDHPITLRAADPANPPRVHGGNVGLHLVGVSHIRLANLAFHGQTDNGINIDDAGRRDHPATDIHLQDLTLTDIGPTGNHDGIKLAGVRHFTIRRCTVTGWAGQSIDLVGCHDGLIEQCTFRGKKGFTQTTGPQVKGGSSNITLRNCDFINGGVRAVNLGGSTGLPYFRPSGALYEARNLTVEGCRFVGSEAPIAFVGVDGATVRYNTLYLPGKWILRILQETTAPGFVPCRDGRFEHNLVIYDRAAVQTPVNIGPNTQPQSFIFADNWWFCRDTPDAGPPPLPTPHLRSIHGIDPRVQLGDDLLPTAPANPRAAPYGAAALPPPQE